MLLAIDLDIEGTPDALEFSVALDDAILANCTVSGATQLTCDIPDADDNSNHQLEFILSGKQPHHTKIDSNGNIVSDLLLKIKSVHIDSIRIDHLFLEHAIYQHDCNGTSELQKQRYAGILGCNGQVILPISFPIYLWLLEHF